MREMRHFSRDHSEDMCQLVKRGKKRTSMSYRWGMFQGWALLVVGFGSLAGAPFGGRPSAILAMLLVGVLITCAGVGLVQRKRYGIALFMLLGVGATFSAFFLIHRPAVYIPTIIWWMLPSILYYPKRWAKQSRHSQGAADEHG